MKKWLLALLLLLPIRSDAQNIPWQAIPFFNLVGGLNDGADATAVSDNEASNLQNVVFTTSGAISKRQGFSNVNSSSLGASAIFSGIGFYKQSGGSRFLVATVSSGATDKIYKMEYGGGTTGPDGTWDDITGALSLAFGADDQADFATAEDEIVIEDGVNSTPPYKWTGSGNAVALGGSPPNASYVEYHKNHLWLAGNDTNPSYLYFSNLNDIETHTGTDFLRVETNDGQIIRGLKSALDCLYVFKDESIWRVCGTNRDDFTLEQMVRGVGTLSNASIVVINNQFIFATAQGDIAVYDGGLNVQIISTKIEGTLTGANQDRFDEAVAVAFDDGTGDEDYYLSISGTGSSAHNIILVYDTFHKAWTKFSGINANSMVSAESGSLQKAIFFGDYSGQANEYPDTNADDGAAISAFYQSGQMRFPQIPQQKVFRIAQVYVNQEGNYNLTFEYRLDFNSTGTSNTISLATSGAVWDSAVYDSDVYADVTTTTGRIEINEEGEFLQWRISNANASEPFTCKGVVIWVEATGRI